MTPAPGHHARCIIRRHLILHGYGHRLPNDSRGGGSNEQRRDKFADPSRKTFRDSADVPDNHLLRSNRPYNVFLHTPDDVRRVADYINDNPSKEGLTRAASSFVQPYDGWPHHESRRP